MNIKKEDFPEKYKEFLDLYMGNFEKRKYFKINMNLETVEKEPSWVLELAFLYYETKNDEIIKLINGNLSECFKDKVKKIDRLSKYSIEEIKSKFWRAIMNKDGIHAVRLGNELILRDEKEFFELTYKYSFISSDINKLIKTYFFELIYKKSGYHIELLKNLLNYFSNSNSEFIKSDSKEYLDYFNKYKVNELYKIIYESESQKYEINHLDLAANAELSLEMELMLSYLKKEGLI